MTYRPKSNFVFGNVNLADYGEAFAFYCNIFDKPERDYEVISVPGRNGDLLLDNGRYKNVERRYIVQVEGIDAAHSLSYNLLNTVGYQKLTDEYDTSYYYMACLKSAPSIIGFVGDAVKMEIVFDRMPQRWLLNESELTGEDTPDSNNVCVVDFRVNNKTLNVATPIVKIEFISASTSQIGDVYVTVMCGGGSDGNIELRNMSSHNGNTIVIDSERRAIYNPITQVNLAGGLYDIENTKWLTIPAGANNYLVRARTSKTGTNSYSIKATLNTRTWEL